jgi:DNA-binding transcriptional ArsR family regulator
LNSDQGLTAELARRGLLPKIVVALRHYDRRQAIGDLTAGLTVGLVALPLAMAFAISSGLSPQGRMRCAGRATFIEAGSDRPLARLHSSNNSRNEAGIKPSPGLQTLKAEFFRALAHPVRIRLLEVLVKSGPTSGAGSAARALGIDQPIVSQQLARLRSSGIVVARKQRTTTFYTVADPLIADLLHVAREILNRHLVGVQGLLRELKSDRHAAPARMRAP